MVTAGKVRARAPGRVNLLGEHTDYNDGYVLPIAIPQQTTVEAAPSGDGRFHVHAPDLDERADFTLEAPPGAQFARYVYGCIRELHDSGQPVGPVSLTVRSEVPMGVGLSSSAALEVATLRALRELFHLSIDDVAIARLAQRAEVRHAGVRCGIMDQMASSLADTHHALFLDTRTLERRLVPLPVECDIAVIDSGVSRSLASSGYNERRAECEEAARRLGVPALRDVDEAAAGGLPEPLRRRARHVASENARVLRAAEGVMAEELGVLMSDSHRSLAQDFEVSTPQIDALVSSLQQEEDVLGAKLTGAGFGGACVALCRRGAARAAGLRALERLGGAGTLLMP